MLSALRDWFYEGLSFIRDIWLFLVSTVYSGRIVWVIVIGIGILVYWRFMRKR
jgi:hypothetical protein